MFNHRKRFSIFARVLRKLCVTFLGEQRGGSVFASLVGLVPGFSSIKITKDGSGFIYHSHTDLRFPGHLHSHKLYMISYGYTDWLTTKYSLDGFVGVEDDDLVIDCGAFAGGFTLAAASRAKCVHSIEPSPRNFEALKANVLDRTNVTPHNIGFFNESKRMDFNLSSTFVDDSLLTPDDGASGNVVTVDLFRIDDWAAAEKIDQIDFLKVEAEGVEEQILQGLGSVKVRKIAVDCSPELDGQPNVSAVVQLLQERGYETAQKRWVVFGRLNGDTSD